MIANGGGKTAIGGASGSGGVSLARDQKGTEGRRDKQEEKGSGSVGKDRWLWLREARGENLSPRLCPATSVEGIGETRYLKDRRGLN